MENRSSSIKSNSVKCHQYHVSLIFEYSEYYSDYENILATVLGPIPNNEWEFLKFPSQHETCNVKLEVK